MGKAVDIYTGAVIDEAAAMVVAGDEANHDYTGEMGTFDRLPKWARQMLAESPVNFQSALIANAIVMGLMNPINAPALFAANIRMAREFFRKKDAEDELARRRN
jgi:hypothetical protein